MKKVAIVRASKGDSNVEKVTVDWAKHKLSRPPLRQSAAAKQRRARLRGIRLYYNNEEKRAAAIARRKALGIKNRQATKRAGLQFNCNFVRRKLVKALNAGRSRKVYRSAGIYCAAVLEYLIAEVVEMSGNCAKELGRGRITPRDLLLAIRGDAEFDQLLKGVIIPAAGVPPYIHKKLLGLAKEENRPKAVTFDCPSMKEEDKQGGSV